MADQLRIEGLAGRLRSLVAPTSDIDLDTTTPRARRHSVWRDRRWFVRWPVDVDELENSVRSGH